MTSNKVSPPVSFHVDKKISLGILWTMLVALIGGVTYMANLNNNLLVATETLKGVRIAIDRNTAQIITADRTTAVLETVVSGMERRLLEVEKELKRGN